MGTSRPSVALEDKPGDLPLREGDVLGGKYRIEEVLGRGGMGVVMAATHLALDQRVALKFLLRSAAEIEHLVARFTREARAAAKLQSEHAARVLDIDVLPTGEPYMVLELLEGSDLADVLRSRGPLPADEAVTHILQACEALAEAHARGIVHRDLKPENLFLANRIDGSKIIKVLDFGISKVCSPGALSPAAGLTLTRTQAVIGSPMYMSPEQLRAAHDADPQSDIWSLGVTLYELIAGTGPFPWNNLPELCAAVLKESPVPLRERCPHVPADLEAAILRCLEKNRADRYRDVAALAAALQPFGKPTACTSSERAARVLVRFAPPLTRNQPSPRSPFATTSRSATVPPAVARAPFALSIPSDSQRASVPPQSAPPSIVPEPSYDDWAGSTRPSFIAPVAAVRETLPFASIPRAPFAAFVHRLAGDLRVQVRNGNAGWGLALILMLAAIGITLASYWVKPPSVQAMKSGRYFSTKSHAMADEKWAGSPSSVTPAQPSALPDAPRAGIAPAPAPAAPSDLVRTAKRPAGNPQSIPPRGAGSRRSSTGLFVDRE